MDCRENEVSCKTVKQSCKKSDTYTPPKTKRLAAFSLLSSDESPMVSSDESDIVTITYI